MKKCEKKTVLKKKIMTADASQIHPKFFSNIQPKNGPKQPILPYKIKHNTKKFHIKSW